MHSLNINANFSWVNPKFWLVIGKFPDIYQPQNISTIRSRVQWPNGPVWAKWVGCQTLSQKAKKLPPGYKTKNISKIRIRAKWPSTVHLQIQGLWSRGLSLPQSVSLMQCISASGANGPGFEPPSKCVLGQTLRVRQQTKAHEIMH